MCLCNSIFQKIWAVQSKFNLSITFDGEKWQLYLVIKKDMLLIFQKGEALSKDFFMPWIYIYVYIYTHTYTDRLGAPCVSLTKRTTFWCLDVIVLDHVTRTVKNVTFFSSHFVCFISASFTCVLLSGKSSVVEWFLESTLTDGEKEFVAFSLPVFNPSMATSPSHKVQLPGGLEYCSFYLNWLHSADSKLCSELLKL